MAAYRLVIEARALRDLEALPGHVVERIGRAVDALAIDPRPRGTKALQGPGRLLRLRVGDYRIVYAIDDVTRLVRIALIGHRREVYRRR